MNDAMSDAIERADLILCFFSKKYEESMNCRKELEFALDMKKKDVIPIKVDKDYRLDRWLGLILRNRKYIEITEIEMVPYKIDELFCEIAAVLLKEKVKAPPPTPPNLVAIYFSDDQCSLGCVLCKMFCSKMYAIQKSHKVVGNDEEAAMAIVNSRSQRRCAIVYCAQYDKVIYNNNRGPVEHHGFEKLLQYAKLKRAKKFGYKDLK